MERLDFSGCSVCVFQPKEPCRTVIYLHSRQEEAERIWSLLRRPQSVLVSIEADDWNGSLSPWYAPKAFRGVEDFIGGAPKQLALLKEHIIPAVEERLGSIMRRGIAGYSLAGLFALWAACETELFDCAASVSGSLWYDGFVSYLRERPMRAKEVYLSLGERERFAKNVRLAAVEECTKAAAEIMRLQRVQVHMEYHSGGHFQDAAVRAAKGITFLTEEKHEGDQSRQIPPF